MELKLKDGVDLGLPLIQNEIELTTIELLGTEEAHTIGEIRVELMVAVVDKMVENGIITTLAGLEGQKLLTYLKDNVEPLYYNIILKDENNKTIINQLLNELQLYFQNVYTQQNSFGGMINYILDFLTNMDEKDLTTVKSLLNTFTNGQTQKKIDKSIIVEKEKASNRLEELIKQYEKNDK